MAATFVIIILALAVAGWVYVQALRRTGGNKNTSLLAAAAVGIVVFIIALTFKNFLPK